MLAFVTSLRHPLNSGDYSRVESLLRDTLASVLRQRCDRFSVWVVGNRAPRGLPDGVNWVPVDFPAPSQTPGPRTGVPAVLRDKGTKLVAGIAAARESAPDHIMLMDADDLVSHRLAELSDRSPRSSGWVITRGWRWSSERASVRRQRDFNLHCGTSHLVRTDLLGVPPALSPQSDQEEILDALGDRLATRFGSHLHLRDQLAAEGHPLEPIPFPAAIYRVGTGENHSGISLGGLGRPVGPRTAGEFGIARSARTPGAIARAVLPSQRGFVERLPWRRG